MKPRLVQTAGWRLLSHALFASLILFIARRTSGRLPHRKWPRQSVHEAPCAPTTQSESSAPHQSMKPREMELSFVSRLHQRSAMNQQIAPRDPIFESGKTLPAVTSPASRLLKAFDALRHCCALLTADTAPKGKSESSASPCHPTWLATDQLMEPTPWLAMSSGHEPISRQARPIRRRECTTSEMVMKVRAYLNYLESKN